MKIKNIKKISTSGTDHFDLTIEKNHNFFADKVLVHNCNLPARNVIILGTTRGINEVDELDIIQMAGRSGRLFPPKYKIVIKNIQDAALTNQESLGLYMLSSINSPIDIDLRKNK